MCVCLVDQDLIDVVLQIISNRADDDVALLVEERLWWVVISSFGNGSPQLQQVVQIPLQLFGGASDTCGADNDTHTIRYFELI